MRCECRGCEHIVVVYGRIGAGSRSDLGKVPLAGIFTMKIEDALSNVHYKGMSQTLQRGYKG